MLVVEPIAGVRSCRLWDEALLLVVPNRVGTESYAAGELGD
jgi:hypothetical protein